MVTQIEDTRPIHFTVRVRHMALNELWEASDAFCREGQACDLTNDPDGEAVAEHCHGLVTDELDRRAAQKADREARKAARIRAEADRWYAEHEAGPSW